jgi:hypothetical protein
MVKNSYKESEELLRCVPENTISNIKHGRENPAYSQIFAISKGLGLHISLVVQIDDGPLQEIIEESSKEFIRFLKDATDEEILKYQRMTFILQRLSKWEE